MSKSPGTGIGAPRSHGEVGRRRAAPLGRLGGVRSTTCASAPNVVEQVGRVYRNLRNRMRFMLSNLDDLDASDVVSRGGDAAARSSRV